MAEITKFVNGLTLICEKLDNFESVVLELWVKSGSRIEKLGEEGICHFIEHMCFQGTNTRNHQDIAEAFDDIGGYFNAGTSRENTVFTAKVLSEDVEKALDVMADVLINSTMNEDSIAKEKKVIEQEIAQCEDNPDENVFDEFMKCSFTDQNLGKSILGSKSSIKKFNREFLHNFYKINYAGHNMVLAIAGKIDIEKITKIVESKFSNLPTSVEKNSAQNTIFTPTKNIILKTNVTQAHVVMGYQGQSFADKNYYLQEIASNILGGSTSSRLFNEIREKRGLSYNVSTFTSSFVDSGILGINADVDNDRLDEFLSAVKEEIQKLADTLSEKELTRVRHQVKAAFLMSKESISNRTSRLAASYVRYGKIIPTEKIVEKYLSYQMQDVKAFFIDLSERINDYSLAVIKKG